MPSTASARSCQNTGEQARSGRAQAPFQFPSPDPSIIEAWWLDELGRLKPDGEESTELGARWASEVAQAAQPLATQEHAKAVVLSPPEHWPGPACVGPLRVPSQQGALSDGDWLADDDAECCSLVVVRGGGRPPWNSE